MSKFSDVKCFKCQIFKMSNGHTFPGHAFVALPWPELSFVVLQSDLADVDACTVHDYPRLKILHNPKNPFNMLTMQSAKIRLLIRNLST